MTGPKSIGSTWLHRYKGKDWPIVLCDDETPPRAFMESRQSDFACPAILLGKHIFIWVRVNDLKPFEPGHDYCEGLPPLDNYEPVHTDDENLKEEKLRRKALIEDAMHFETHTFWNKYIMTKSAARKQEIEMRANKKRSIADHFTMTGGARAKSGQHEKRRRSNDGRQLLTPAPTPRKSGKSVMRSIEIEHISDDDEDEDEDDEAEEARLERIRQKNVQAVKDHLPSMDYCTIFVGTEYTRFTANRIAMGKCNLLSDMESYTDELGSHIMLYEHVDIQKDRFEPIAEYLRQGDFAPRFAKAITTDRFEDPIFMPEQKDEAAQQIAMVFHTAAKIQFEDVQKLCLRKLMLLDALEPNLLLLLVRIFQTTEKYGAEIEDVMVNWLAEQISKQFWKLVETAYMTLGRVMKSDQVLSQRVFEKLAKDPAAAGDVDDD